MENPIVNLPVKFNNNYEIVDSKGTIVVPSIVWKNSWVHQKHQGYVGLFLEHLINNYKSNVDKK